MSEQLSRAHLDRLTELLCRLIDQQAARILVSPYENATGFWFGGGNPVRDDGGALWLTGRFRNYGDSRTGLAQGERGLECALFKSDDDGQSFTKACSWTKAELSYPDNAVLSIEGTALHRLPDGRWELFISTEKERSYPDHIDDYRKPTCGVWSIDVITGPAPGSLDPGTIRCVLREDEDPAHIHLKDPVLFDRGDDTVMIYCSHPFCWSCSNSGYTVRPGGSNEFGPVTHQMVCRGATWDVAATRITDRMPVPRLGLFADQPPVSIYFYDGAECVREHEQSTRGVARPRGYSCEEIGGAFYGFDAQFPVLQRLSTLQPLFTSPWGTGCSRYVHTLVEDQGIFATWERSQPDLSQPLVGNALPASEVTRILS